MVVSTAARVAVQLVAADEFTPGLVPALAAADRSAILLWLRHSTASPAGRRSLALDMLRRSVFTQARYLGVVECSGCGDAGCELCAPTDGRPFPW